MAEIEYFGSKNWAGVRFGYVYKQGARGLGYYLDAARKKVKAPVVNPLTQKKEKKAAAGVSKRQIWQQAKDPKAKQLNGGREGSTIEERLSNAGLLTEVEAVKTRDAEAADKSNKQAALFKAAIENPGSVPYIPTDEFKGAKVCTRTPPPPALRRCAPSPAARCRPWLSPSDALLPTVTARPGTFSRTE